MIKITSWNRSYFWPIQAPNIILRPLPRVEGWNDRTRQWEEGGRAQGHYWWESLIHRNRAWQVHHSILFHLKKMEICTCDTQDTYATHCKAWWWSHSHSHIWQWHKKPQLCHSHSESQISASSVTLISQTHSAQGQGKQGITSYSMLTQYFLVFGIGNKAGYDMMEVSIISIKILKEHSNCEHKAQGIRNWLWIPPASLYWTWVQWAGSHLLVVILKLLKAGTL